MKPAFCRLGFFVAPCVRVLVSSVPSLWRKRFALAIVFWDFMELHGVFRGVSEQNVVKKSHEK